MGVLTDSALAVAEVIRAGVDGASSIVSVSDEKRAPLVAPFISIDAPRITEWRRGLAVPRVRATVPVRVSAANTSDYAGLLALTDAVLEALDGTDITPSSITPGALPMESAPGASPLPLFTIECVVLATL